jgi:hypothetical protein
VVPALQTQQYLIYFRGVRLDDASFYHSTYNNLHHQNMVVCLGVWKVKEHVLECEDSVEASYHISYALIVDHLSMFRSGRLGNGGGR